MVRTRTLTIRDGREANFATLPMRRLFRKGDYLSKNDGSVAVRPVFPRELSRKNNGFPPSGTGDQRRRTIPETPIFRPPIRGVSPIMNALIEGLLELVEDGRWPPYD